MCKALPWIDSFEGIQTSDHWGAHLRLDQWNYPLSL
jgi:hypothetical protein